LSSAPGGEPGPWLAPPVFERDGDLLVPTIAAAGPWSHDALRIELIEAEIQAGGEVVARATGLRIRAGDVEPAPGTFPALDPLPPPDTGHPPVGIESWGPGLISALELLVARGEVREPGPAAAWFWLHDHGVGLAESTLWDSEGPIGHSLQSLLVGPRS
jgi:hypothetical protein